MSGELAKAMTGDSDAAQEVATELETEGATELDGAEDGEVSQTDGYDEGTDNTEGDRYSEIEAQARQEGWDPDFKGPAHLKKTAEEFLRDGAHIKKVLKDRNSRLEAERNDYKRELQEAKDMMKQLIGFNVEQKRRAEESKIRELEEAKKAAIYSGDVEEVDKAQQDIDKIKKSREAEVDPGAAQWNKVFTEWQKENTWYGKDMFLSAEADTIATSYLDTGRFKPGPELIKAVERKLRTMYADELDAYTNGTNDADDDEDQPKRKVAPVNSPKKKGQVTPNATRGKTFSDVPKKDQEIFFTQRELFGKDKEGKWVYTQEDFLKSYQFEG